MYWQIYRQIDLKRRLVSIKASRTKSFGSAIDNWDEVSLSLAASYWDILGMSVGFCYYLCHLWINSFTAAFPHWAVVGEPVPSAMTGKPTLFSLLSYAQSLFVVFLALRRRPPYVLNTFFSPLFSYILLAFPIFLCPTFFFRVCP